MREVRGALKGDGGGTAPLSARRRLCPATSTRASTPRWKAPAATSGWRASDAAAYWSNEADDGRGSGSHGSVGKGTGRDRGPTSRKAASSDGPRHPVQHGVVELGHQGRAATGQAFDHHHLPQRAVRVERAAHDVGDQVVAARRPPPGSGRLARRYVVVELELGVVDPHRVVQAEGHPQRPLAQPGHQVDPLLDHPADLGVTGGRRERATVGPRAGRAPARPPRAGGWCRRLERQEGAVEAGAAVPRQRPLCPKPPVPRSAGGQVRLGHRVELRPSPPPGSPAGRSGRPAGPRSPRLGSVLTSSTASSPR